MSRRWLTLELATLLFAAAFGLGIGFANSYVLIEHLHEHAALEAAATAWESSQ